MFGLLEKFILFTIWWTTLIISPTSIFNNFPHRYSDIFIFQLKADFVDPISIVKNFLHVSERFFLSLFLLISFFIYSKKRRGGGGSSLLCYFSILWFEKKKEKSLLGKKTWMLLWNWIFSFSSVSPFTIFFYYFLARNGMMGRNVQVRVGR